MSQIDQDILEAFLKSRQPRNMLLIGPQAQLLVNSWCLDNPACDVTRVEDASRFRIGDNSSQFEFSVLAGALSSHPRLELEQLIASLRDRYSRQLVVQLDPAPTNNDTMAGENAPALLQVSDLRALGLRQLAGSERLFQFNLDDYKIQPDWLNSQYWANPKRWNKERW